MVAVGTGQTLLWYRYFLCHSPDILYFLLHLPFVFSFLLDFTQRPLFTMELHLNKIYSSVSDPYSFDTYPDPEF
jgi:hypothetical protein